MNGYCEDYPCCGHQSGECPPPLDWSKTPAQLRAESDRRQRRYYEQARRYAQLEDEGIFQDDDH